MNYILEIAGKTALILLATAALFLFSCNSGSGSQSTSADSVTASAAPVYDKSLAAGKVTDSVQCRNDNGQNYALYLPSFYSPNRQFPCIYFFDAHARGALPVRAYKDVAEKYGFVLVGSNLSKNGTPWQVTNEGVKTLMADTRSRINIDPKRIYTAGFSGGSRVASSIAIMDGGVAGVVGCAAGFPSAGQGIPNKFDYFGIVGDYDFNLTEMVQLDRELAQNGFSHQLLTSGDIHGWAAASDFLTAVLWLQVNGMKEHLQPENDTQIKDLRGDFDKRIAAAVEDGDWIKAHDLFAGISRVLDGLADITTYKKQLTLLEAKPDYKKATEIQQQLQTIELGQQQELQKQFAAQNEQWWTGKIAELNKNVRNAKNPQEVRMYRRLLNYLGLVGYMYSDHALKSDDLNNAEVYLKVFKMADPQNPDCGYLSAIYFMEKGDKQRAISSLNDAASLGYSELSKLASDPAFASLRDDAAFKDVLNKVRVNYTSKG